MILSQARCEKTSVRHKRTRINSSQMQLLFLALPAFLIIFVFAYLPMGGVIIAFKDFKYAKGIFGSAWNGLDNFKFFFQSNDALRIIRNTLGYNVTFLVLGMIFSMALALLVSFIRKSLISRFYQSALILPHLMSWVIVAYISLTLLDYNNGVLNQVLKACGSNVVSWYSEPKYWPFILTFSHLWKTVGYNCLVYYASIIGIDESLYEAARIDGATTMQCVKHITIPMITNTMIVLLILGVGGIFGGDFGLFYQMTQNSGFLVEVSDVIPTYNFRTLMVLGNVGVSAAVGFLQSILGMLLVLGTNWVANRIDDGSGLF